MLLLWVVEFALCSIALGAVLALWEAPATLAAPLAGSLHGSLAATALQPATLFVPLARALASVNHAALLALSISLPALAIGLYRPAICLETPRMVANTLVTGLLAFPAVMLVSDLLGIGGGSLSGNAALLAQVLIAWLAVLLVTRATFRLAVQREFFVRRLLVLGDGGSTLPLAPGGFLSVAATLGTTELASATLEPESLKREGIWGLVLAPEARAALPAEPLLRCKCAGIQVFGEEEFREQQLRRLDIERLPPGWLLAAPGLVAGRLQDAVRRTLDIGFSLALLIFALPLMLLTALLIRLESRGPVFYKQERIGLYGQVFTLTKFRSMRVDAEAAGPAWAAQRDPRVTRVGAFIRRTRIDELPQLLNVLRGEMSIVGPRPERPHFVAQLAEAIPNYRDRAYVKPGLTGWAQINFPYGASVEDARMKLAYDLYYVKHRSLVLDLFILLSTVRVILFQEGAR